MFGLKLVADVFGVLCELIIIRYYFTHLMNEPIISKRLFYILNGICLLLMTATTLIPNNQWILPVSNFVFLYLLSFLFRKKWYVRLFFSVILYLICAISEAAIGVLLVFLTQMNIGDVRDDFLMYVIGLLTSKILVFLLIKILGYKRLGVYKSMPARVFAGLLLTPISSIVAMYTIFINLRYYVGWQIMLIVLITSILLCVSNFFVFYLFENQIKTERTKAKLALAERQIHYYGEMSRRQSEIRVLSHDMKNYMTGLWGFAEKGNLDETKRCIEKISTKLETAGSAFDTGHLAVDAILQSKKQGMDDLQVRFDAFIALPKQISVDELDLCVILGNGLDNAMEACAKLPEGQERYIRLTVNVQSTYISVSIENPTDKAEISTERLKTTKPDSFYHGLGLESMRAVTDKYDGILNAGASHHVFKLAAMLKNK